MTVVRNVFTDPFAVVPTYTWGNNHESETESGKQRAINLSSPTSGLGLIRQQGDDTPYRLIWQGRILTRAHYRAMWQWFQLCRSQTIFLTDFDGQQYEGQITNFQPKRIRGFRSPAADPNTFTWEYTFEFDVYRFMNGDLATVGVTP